MFHRIGKSIAEMMMTNHNMLEIKFGGNKSKNKSKKNEY